MNIELRKGRLYDTDQVVVVNGEVVKARDVGRLVYELGRIETEKYRKTKPHWRIPGAVFWTVFVQRCATARDDEEFARICEEHGL